MTEFNLKEFNKSIRADIAKKALETKPYLVIIQVGNNPASDVYVRNKIKACEECNIKVKLDKLPEDISEDELLSRIKLYNGNYRECEHKTVYFDYLDSSKEDKLNSYIKDGWELKSEQEYGDSKWYFVKYLSPIVSGIIVQMPLPDHIDPLKVCKVIDPNKDVDGFNPINIGRHALGEKNCFIPATVRGVSSLIHALESEGISNNIGIGARCVIIGRSNIVGKPMAYEMINKYGFTTTVCNSHTHYKVIANLCQDADIIIVAVGKPKFLKKNYFKYFYGFYSVKKPVIIDVGINRLSDGKIVGDCDYDALKDYCAYITPVPGGVGPLTITGLLHNVAYYKDYQV